MTATELSRQQTELRSLTYGLLFILLGSTLVLDMSLGSVNIPARAIFTILTGGQPENAAWKTIVLIFRLPKALTAGFAGAALAVSGLLMQTLFRNPLAGPSVLGISSGASLGVAGMLFVGASVLFRAGLRRYASASS